MCTCIFVKYCQIIILLSIFLVSFTPLLQNVVLLQQQFFGKVHRLEVFNGKSEKKTNEEKACRVLTF